MADPKPDYAALAREWLVVQGVIFPMDTGSVRAESLSALLERVAGEAALVPVWPRMEPVVESRPCPLNCVPGCHVVTVGGYEAYHGISRTPGEKNPEWILSRLCIQLADAQKEIERLRAGFCDEHRPSPSRSYAGCWGCSRNEEMELRQKAEAAVERLTISMLGHFQREHLEGDGPEIDRWKLCAKKAEADLAVSQDALDAEGSAASEARAAQRKAEAERDGWKFIAHENRESIVEAEADLAEAQAKIEEWKGVYHLADEGRDRAREQLADVRAQTAYALTEAGRALRAWVTSESGMGGNIVREDRGRTALALREIEKARAFLTPPQLQPAAAHRSSPHEPTILHHYCPSCTCRLETAEVRA